ncbi:MAG: hypothetical protein GC131_01565 [Alphaproteobacteria bacterium]|nr:hypothetical protein [Alphaproteobacteria bacterium]
MVAGKIKKSNAGRNFFIAWLLISILWVGANGLMYFLGGLHKDFTAPQRWEQEYVPEFKSLQKEYADEKERNPDVKPRFSAAEFAKLEGADLVDELKNRNLLKVWCQVLNIVNTEMKDYQPVHKIEYFMYRTGVNPRFFVKNFLPASVPCKDIIPVPASQHNQADTSDRFRFAAMFRPSGAMNVQDVLSRWQADLQAQLRHAIAMALAVPIALFVLGFLILRIGGGFLPKRDS